VKPVLRTILQIHISIFTYSLLWGIVSACLSSGASTLFRSSLGKAKGWSESFAITSRRQRRKEKRRTARKTSRNRIQVSNVERSNRINCRYELNRISPLPVSFSTNIRASPSQALHQCMRTSCGPASQSVVGQPRRAFPSASSVISETCNILLHPLARVPKVFDRSPEPHQSQSKRFALPHCKMRHC
jgi:hypothetical protein